MSDQVVAFPSVGAGGIECERSAHFGHCDTFTLVELDGVTITGVGVIENPPHAEGGCLASVNLLASHGVTAIIVAGMGARPLAGFQDAGIDVYFENQTPVVGDAVARLLAGECDVMGERHTCKGH